jgi:GntR family transcriptional regulator, transcriptional repressor for pyruvate dehydrogenase complex
VVDGADSIAFRLMFNSLRAAYEPLLAALATVMQVEVGRPEAYQTLADAVAAGDPQGARAAAEDLLSPATATILTAIGQLEARP